MAPSAVDMAGGQGVGLSDLSNDPHTADAEPAPKAWGNLKAHPATVALTVNCYEKLAAEHPGGSFPPFQELQQLTQENYVAATLHVLGNNAARTRFEEIVLSGLEFQD